MEDIIGGIDPPKILHSIAGLVRKSGERLGSEERREYELHVTRALNNFIGKLIPDIEKFFVKPSPEDRDVLSAWGELRREIDNKERELRREELLQPTSKQDFQATLWWMAERGAPGDLEYLRSAAERADFPDLKELIEDAEKRIKARAAAADSAPASEEAQTCYGLPTASDSDVQHLSWESYLRQLPSLTRQAPGKWVAFHGERQVAMGESARDVYAQLKRLGVPPGETVVRRVGPLAPPLELRRLHGRRAG